MFSALSDKLESAFKKLRGQGRISESNVSDAMQEIRMALLEADVDFKVAKDLVDAVAKQSIGAEVLRTVSPGQQIVKIFHDELVKLLGSDASALNLDPPQRILMTGLNGAGKTTTSAKLASWLKKQGRRPLLLALDLYRPAAVKQLQVLGQQLNVPVFAPDEGETDPVKAAKASLEWLKAQGSGIAIFDTAGRQDLDEALLAELKKIREIVQPNEVLLVADAATGQQAVSVAQKFNEAVGITGLIMTKLDGDARGGALLSMRQVTGCAVKFLGVGEKVDQLEVFHPDRMSQRILGMGDVVGLMKDFEDVVDEKKAEEDAKRMLRGQFTLDDFLEQLQTLQSMGPLQDLLDKVPFFADSMPEGFQVDEREIGQIKAIVSSMTRQERAQAELFQKQPSRVVRVAKGSGTAEKQVAEILQRFAFMKQMMGSIGSQAGMLGKIPGMKQLATANRLRDAVKTGGLEGNPMMANLADQLLEAAVAEQGGLAPGAGQRRVLDKGKKKSKRKMQKKSRRKSRR